MRENRTSGSMRRGERRVMVHSANVHRTRKGGNGGAPPDLDTTALALHSTERTVITATSVPMGCRRTCGETNRSTRRPMAPRIAWWPSDVGEGSEGRALSDGSALLVG